MSREIIREVCYKENADPMCMLMHDGWYTHALSIFMALFEEAKKDFPDLVPENVRVEKYGGESRKNMWGIEFLVRGNVPSSYKRVSELEMVK